MSESNGGDRTKNIFRFSCPVIAAASACQGNEQPKQFQAASNSLILVQQETSKWQR